MNNAPPVVTWYKVYAGLMAAMYLLLVAAGAAMPFWIGADTGVDATELWVPALAFGCISLPLAAAYVAAFFVPVKPWAWIYHLVLICIGLTSACCMLASIPLLIFWIRPETKAYFGRA